MSFNIFSFNDQSLKNSKSIHDRAGEKKCSAG